jgi:hypothetical protein
MHRPSIPRVLEAAAAYFARIDRFVPAAMAWLQAEALRAEMEVVRFPAEEPYARKTLQMLTGALGADWRDAVNLPPGVERSADPLAWLTNILESEDAEFATAPSAGAQ